VCSLSGFWVQDVAVKVFLDQHVQMEAIEEFKAEVCVSVMSHSCKTFHQVFRCEKNCIIDSCFVWPYHSMQSPYIHMSVRYLLICMLVSDFRWQL
jgi:hypothetical protein